MPAEDLLDAPDEVCAAAWAKRTPVMRKREDTRSQSKQGRTRTHTQNICADGILTGVDDSIKLQRHADAV